jgi:hypothetical protein
MGLVSVRFGLFLTKPVRFGSVEVFRFQAYEIETEPNRIFFKIF